MATVRKNGKSWQAIIRRTGYPALSKTFPLKSQASAWAAVTERDLLAGRHNPHKHTVDDAPTRYAKEVSPKKRGERWEVLRIGAFRLHQIATKPLSRLSEADVAAWREDRLHSVSGATVRREMNLWQSVFEVCRKEWKWLDKNPVDDVKKPLGNRPRQRGVSQAEIDALGLKLVGPQARQVYLGFLLGIETGMRAGEMWTLEPAQVDLQTRVAHLLKTKNGDQRDVPLSPRAVEIFRELGDDLFTVSIQSRDVLFRKARQAAGLGDVHFHDSRSEGISRLSKVFDILELARVVGHRDPKSLMIYYRADASELAMRLAVASATPTLPPRSTGGKRKVG